MSDVLSEYFLPDIVACNCGLRRFFTSLYSLPSFLFLLGAASLPPSLIHTEVRKIMIKKNQAGLDVSFGFVLIMHLLKVRSVIFDFYIDQSLLYWP